MRAVPVCPSALRASASCPRPSLCSAPWDVPQDLATALSKMLLAECPSWLPTPAQATSSASGPTPEAQRPNLSPGPTGAGGPGRAKEGKEATKSPSNYPLLSRGAHHCPTLLLLVGICAEGEGRGLPTVLLC